jgi:hypothetical protein
MIRSYIVGVKPYIKTYRASCLLKISKTQLSGLRALRSTDLEGHGMGPSRLICFHENASFTEVQRVNVLLEKHISHIYLKNKSCLTRDKWCIR